ncbi:hypothetical protein GCM10009802_28960 [Streptomyces synnematoformans]|uniref:Uncharacterized protein n=1 Tax=Streptomyces synnematoformans TaxID=415721 RepID=A0ABN2YAC8_9ACTN
MTRPGLPQSLPAPRTVTCDATGPLPADFDRIVSLVALPLSGPGPRTVPRPEVAAPSSSAPGDGADRGGGLVGLRLEAVEAGSGRRSCQVRRGWSAAGAEVRRF